MDTERRVGGVGGVPLMPGKSVRIGGAAAHWLDGVSRGSAAADGLTQLYRPGLPSSRRSGRASSPGVVRGVPQGSFRRLRDRPYRTSTCTRSWRIE
ncbi:hypothetical protein AB5I41_14195 [Sphingomonas sp. MMS24-JH45]